MSNPRKFIAVASKPHAAIAGELANAIKTEVYRYADRIPLALAVGVLAIVQKELIDEAQKEQP